MKSRLGVVGLLAAVTLLAASWSAAELPVLAKDFTQDRPPPPSLKCPGDTIVWINTKTCVYHLPGMTWYGGHTKEGKVTPIAKDADLRRMVNRSPRNRHR